KRKCGDSPRLVGAGPAPPATRLLGQPRPHMRGEVRRRWKIDPAAEVDEGELELRHTLLLPSAPSGARGRATASISPFRASSRGRSTSLPPKARGNSGRRSPTVLPLPSRSTQRRTLFA